MSDSERPAPSEAAPLTPREVEGLAPSVVEGFDWPPRQEDLDQLDTPLSEHSGLRRAARIHWITQDPISRHARLATDINTSHESRFDAWWVHAPVATSRSINWTAAIYAMCGLVLVIGSFLVLGLMSALSLAVARPPIVTRNLAVPINPPYFPVTLDQAVRSTYATEFLERFSVDSNAKLAAPAETTTARSHAPAGARTQDLHRITPFVADNEPLANVAFGYRSSVSDTTALSERSSHDTGAELTASSTMSSNDGAFTPPRRLSEFYVRPQVAVASEHPVTGEVELTAQVLDNGEVGAVETVASTLPGLGMEEAALAAVKQWRYTPALANGHPVESRVRVLVSFR